MAIDCTNLTISDEELINGLLVKTNTGFTGLRTRRVSASAANITPVIGSAEFNFSNGTILRHAIGLSVSGQPAIILIEEA